MNKISLIRTVNSTRTLFGRKCIDSGNFQLITKPGKISPEKPVPENVIKKPHYVYEKNSHSSTEGVVEIKSNDQIALMRKSCRLAANILKQCEGIIQVGVTTDRVDEILHKSIIAQNAYPSPLRYCGFPKSVCTSINNVACHGIPSVDHRLLEGDIINVDITVFLNGFHGDCSRTFLVGKVDEMGQHLVQSSELALANAIQVCGPNQPFKLIGKTISKIAKKRRLSIVNAFVGHGIGSYFHGPPEVLHYDNENMGVMLPGMTFTIEPILSLGGSEVRILDDAWTAVTIDNSRTAQSEHTILITEHGCEVLTQPDNT